MPASDWPHSHTPSLAVVDPRGLAVRGVEYCRSDSSDTAETRASQQSWSPAGHPRRTADPRLGPDSPILVRHTSLSGKVLMSDSADAGWTLHLHNEAGAEQRSWDGRHTMTRFVHDSLLRLVEVAQTGAQGDETVVERLDYGNADPALALHNQCGRLLRHDDPAGSLHLIDYALGGGLMAQRRRFLKALDPPDWPEDSTARDRLLEDGQGYLSSCQFNPPAQQIACSDAMGNLHQFSHDLAGALAAVDLTLAATGQNTPLVSDIRYNAQGQFITQKAGNGVTSHALYDAANGRPTSLRTCHPDGTSLQDLHYEHDPAGNLLSSEDRALPVRHHRNQRIEPVRHYRYDSLYQLIETTGWEQDNAEHGPHLPDPYPTPLDPARLRNYRQTYRYDAAGNLVELRHVGASQYTRSLIVAADSNRAVAARTPGRTAIDDAFDANGNLLQLQPGQALHWDLRNQLGKVAQVTRDQGPDDDERYVYDGSGQRARKVWQHQVAGRQVHSEVRYLPGLELHRNDTGDTWLQVVFGKAGHSDVQVLHWPQDPPDDIDNDQFRYQLHDHLGACCLELDACATLLSHEQYYPFGASACWAARSPGNAGHRRRRYSGKERDASGLYYYGRRYYAPWLMRWINPDPAGYGDGLNLYRMVGNNPLTYQDARGTQKIPADILIDDALHGVDIGSGWFEELRWDAVGNTFQTTRSVYSRGMQVLQSSPEWTLSEEGSAIAIFRDRNNNLRLFTNTFQRHMGIQPGMGLPLFAGRIRSGAEGGIVFDNHSGHYKPLANVASVESLLGQLAPGARNVRYEPIAQSGDFSPAVRLDVASPEAYVDLVDSLKGGYQKVVGYLQEAGLWDDIKATYSSTPGIKVLLDAHELGISPNEVHQRNALVTRTAAPPPVAGKSPERRENLPVPPQHSTAVSTHQSHSWGALFRKCVGR